MVLTPEIGDFLTNMDAEVVFSIAHKGSRRSGNDRRHFPFAAVIEEKRVGSGRRRESDRRTSVDRRRSVDRRKGAHRGKERRSGIERRANCA